MAYHPFGHLGLKLVSIGLAVLLWLTVAREPIVERSLRVPLQFQNVPARLEIVGDSPGTVDVRVRGSSALVSRVEPGEIVAVLDLRAARPGSRLFHVLPDDVRVPFGVDVEQVLPATVQLEFEKTATRIVPVVPVVDGEPAGGFVVGQITSDPATVEITGPESKLRQVTAATSEPVSVQGAKSDVTDVVTVGVADSAVRLTQARTATVRVAIKPAPIERTVQGVPVRPVNLPDHLKAELVPPTVKVDVRGTADALRDLQPQTINAFVDLAGLGPGRYNLPVRTDPPQDVGLGRIEPSAIQVRIK